MWIIIRILLLFGAMLYRVIFRRVPTSFPLNFSGVNYAHKVNRGKHGKKISEYIEAPLPSNCVFCLSSESTWDRIFKSVGLAEELSVGDSDFDRQIYITGDQPNIAEFIRARRTLRETICRLVPHRLKSISITGKSLRFEISPNSSAAEVLHDFAECFKDFSGINRYVVAPYSDAFFRRAMIAEFIAWGIFGYAVGGYFEYYLIDRDLHLNPLSIVTTGLGVAAVAMVVLFWLVIMFFRGSSRGPRVITECILLISLGLPVASMEAVSDINTSFDRGASLSVVREISHREKRIHRRRRSTYYTYHLFFSPPSEMIQLDSGKEVYLPSEMKVSSSVYNSARDKLDLEIGQGALGFPWYKTVAGQPRL